MNQLDHPFTIAHDGKDVYLVFPDVADFKARLDKDVKGRQGLRFTRAELQHLAPELKNAALYGHADSQSEVWESQHS